MDASLKLKVKQSSSRIVWIDIYRVAAMLIIIAGHSGLWEGLLNIVNLSCVQMFFVISVLFTKVNDKPGLASRVKQLVFPLLSWVGLYVSYSFYIAFHKLDYLDQSSITIFSYLGTANRVFFSECGYHLWFLAALVFFTLLLPFICMMSNVVLVILIFIFILISLLVDCSVCLFGILSLGHVSLFCLGFAFYLIGFEIKRNIGVAKLTVWLEKNVYSTALFVVCSLLLIQGIKEISPACAKVGIILISTFSLVPFVVWISLHLRRLSMVIIKLAPSVFLTYCIHIFFLFIWRNCVYGYVNEVNSNIEEVIFYFFPFTCIICGYYLYNWMKKRSLISQMFLIS